LSIAFGDFAEAYLIADRQGLRLLRDPFTDKPNVRFYAYRRVGGGVANFEAVKLLKFADKGAGGELSPASPRIGGGGAAETSELHPVLTAPGHFHS